LNVITFALPLASAAALCRIWDKRSGTANIADIAHRLASEGQTDSAVEHRRKLVVKIAASADVEAARAYRNERLSHSSRAGDMRAATGREDDVLDRTVPRLLDETISVVETLNDLLDLKYRWSLRERQQDWRDLAADFWRVAAAAL
jgi:AbiU2